MSMLLIILIVYFKILINLILLQHFQMEMKENRSGLSRAPPDIAGHHPVGAVPALLATPTGKVVERMPWKALETWMDKSMPASFILELLDLILKCNIFELDGELFQQIIGTAMGTRAAPTFS